MDITGCHTISLALGDSDISIDVVTDPLNNKFGYSVGNSLWGASIELVQYVASDPVIAMLTSPTRGGSAAEEAVSTGAATDTAVTSTAAIVNTAATSYAGVSVLELGAGCGPIGSAMAAMGARVVVSDLAEVVPLMECNIDINSELRQKRTEGSAAPAPTAMALDWCDIDNGGAREVGAAGPYDVVFGAEVTYDAELHAPLLDVMDVVVTPGHCGGGGGSGLGSAAIGTRVIIGIPMRDDDPEFVERARERGYSPKLLHSFPASPDHSSEIEVWQFTKADGKGADDGRVAEGVVEAEGGVEAEAGEAHEAERHVGARKKRKGHGRAGEERRVKSKGPS